MILDTAQAQFQPEEKVRRKYTIRSDDTDEDYDYFEMDNDSDGVKVSSDNVDEQFTIDDIANLNKQVRNKVSVVEMLDWMVPFWLLSERPLEKAWKEHEVRFDDTINIEDSAEKPEFSD